MRVAAIIPVYNGERFLRGAVESVIAQTEPPAELVVVDDGSTDDSLSVIEDLEPPFSVSVVRQENSGQSAARNRGVATCDAELLAFLDQDDRWRPGHLAALTAPFADGRVGWTYCNVDELDEHGDLLRTRMLDHLATPHPLTSVEQMVAANMHILPSAAVIRRQAFDAVGGFDERLSGYEDDDLFLRLFRAGFACRYIDEALTAWRVWERSSAHSPRMQRSERIYAEKLFVELAADPGDPAGRLVAPRFFANAMATYHAAMEARDWPGCARALVDLRRYAARLSSRRLRRQLRLELMASPRVYAKMKRLAGLVRAMTP